MRLKLLTAILLPCILCAGQSVLTTPADSARPAASNDVAPSSTDRQALPQGPLQLGGTQTNGSANQSLPASDSAPERATTTANRPAPGPLPKRSEFQQFAEDATGRPLPVYGRQLFDQSPSTFAPVENVPVPADYVLGPGDQLLIRAWGKIELNSRETIDRNGQINLPRVGTLTVAGLRYSQVEGYLRSSISALFKDFELNVTLGQLRTIQIFVLGDARQPGAYTVSSLSTLVDAIFSSGGPSASGSMRRIELRRAGQVITEFDFYDLIEKGDKSRDVRLLPGDVLFTPPVGPQIAISGDLNRPGIYELKGKETIAAALAYAGGVTSLADTERAVLERIENHGSRHVEEFALDEQGKAHPVKDGDLLRIFPLSPKFANAVTLRGSVAQPGLYAWKEGMRVSNLIPSRNSLIVRDYWNQQNHLVQSDPEHAFAEKLRSPLENPSRDVFGNPHTNSANSLTSQRLGNSDDQRSDAQNGQQKDVFGNPRTDQSFGSPDSRTVTSIGRNSAEINWEYALIERLDEHDLSTRLIPFRLSSAIDTPDSADNQLLKPGDVVTIFSRADLELPMEKHATFVRVGGEVNAPGIYRVNPGENLRDVVEKAGGLTEHSYLFASIFARVSTRIAQEAQLRQSAEQMQGELVTKYANTAPQSGQTATDQQAQLALQQSALARLTSIHPTGRVVLNLKPDAAAVADIPAFLLEDGDAFYIPPRPSTIQVAGAVYNANAFQYVPGEHLVRYLNDAGGATREADQKRTFVIRADGTVVSRQSRNINSHGSFEHLKLLPGDAIVVPEKLKVSSGMNQFLQMTQLASQLAISAAALSVIK